MSLPHSDESFTSWHSFVAESVAVFGLHVMIVWLLTRGVLHVHPSDSSGSKFGSDSWAAGCGSRFYTKSAAH